MAITYGNIGGAEPSTLTFKAATVVIQRGSTNEQQEIICLGDPQSSVGVAAVTNALPPSNAYGLNVRVVSGPSSAADFAATVTQSSTNWAVQSMPASTGWAAAAGFVVDSSNYLRVKQDAATRVNIGSTAADNAVTATISGTPTIANTRFNIGSSAADNVVTVGAVSARMNIGSTATDNAVLATPVSTGWVKLAGFSVDSSNYLFVKGDAAQRYNIGSTAADNAVVATIGTNLQSTSVPAAGSSGLNVWLVGGNRLNIGSTATDNAVVATIGTNLQSTSAPSSNSSGLIVRQVWDIRNTVASSNAFASTSLTINSSAANVRAYVTAYSITSTVSAATKIAFYDGASMLWPVQLQAVSSGISGANLSAYPYIFRGSVANALTLQTPSSVAGFKVGVSYYIAP